MTLSLNERGLALADELAAAGAGSYAEAARKLADNLSA